MTGIWDVLQKQKAEGRRLGGRGLRRRSWCKKGARAALRVDVAGDVRRVWEVDAMAGGASSAGRDKGIGGSGKEEALA